MQIKFNQSSLEGEVSLPASKSISNRILMLQALCDDHFEILNLAESSDTKILQQSLITLLNSDEKFIDIDLFDAGTPFRFLTAFACLLEGRTIYLHGTERLHQRPIKALVDALQQMGADIHFEKHDGFAPLVVYGGGIRGGVVRITGNISSQFLSALCIVAPSLEFGVEIEITEEVISAPYLEMTLELMRRFGIHIGIKRNSFDEIKYVKISRQLFEGDMFIVNGDWSSAVFFYAMAMLSDTVNLRLCDLEMDGLQGDELISIIANDFGIVTEQEGLDILINRSSLMNENYESIYSFQNYPDLAVPFIVACAIKYPKCKFEGLHHLALKESNRILALQNELEKVGIELKYENNLLSISHLDFINRKGSVHFKSYEDHRIVMALSLFALVGFRVEFDKGDCVSKSFPNYFRELKKIGFEIID
jgi:3-phosphoshikimate 1-carboxyvinyltransferase